MLIKKYMSNKRKTILITGVTGGIGSEIAQKFLDNNWDVYGIARTKHISRELENHKNFYFLSVDISSGKDVQKLFNSLSITFDAIINCAGILSLKNLNSVTEKEISEMIDINLKGSLYIAKYGNTHFLKKKKKGTIIYIGSRWGVSGSKKDPTYAASKSALRAMVKSLQNDNLNTGIRHILLSPGSVQTNMSLSVDKKTKDKILYAKDIADLAFYIVGTPNRVIFEEILIKAFPYDFINQ